MDPSASLDYNSLFALYLETKKEGDQAKEERDQAKEERDQAKEERDQAKEQRDQAQEMIQKTTFEELIRHCHYLISRPLRAGNPLESTKGTIPSPTGKYCPLELREWTDCDAQQQEIYRSVCNYLRPAGGDAARLYTSLAGLEQTGKLLKRPIASEKDLQGYEEFGVETHVSDIVAQLCMIPAARQEFALSGGILFENHGNKLDPNEDEEKQQGHRKGIPDQFCMRRIHRIENNSDVFIPTEPSYDLIATVEYKPPHKLSVEKIREGLRPMKFWAEIVQSRKIPVEEPAKSNYQAARLAGSAVVQEYHVMIQEGLEYSYLTTGLALVLLRVPRDEPSTLYYHLCDPNTEITHAGQDFLQKPLTAIARVLCLCLMSFRSEVRDQDWRNSIKDNLQVWKTSFEYTLSGTAAQESPSESDSKSSKSSEDYLPSSSTESPSPKKKRQVSTKLWTRCAPSNTAQRDESSDSETDPTPRGKKRPFSQVTSASSPRLVQRTAHLKRPQEGQSGQRQQHTAQFCTQKCLLGLQQNGELDDHCPNFKLHQQGTGSSKHLVDAETLVQLLKQQLDKSLNHDCTPMGRCGSYGAPFKLTCTAYGYTVVGKGTTPRLWDEVSREADIYRILRRAQGSAVPVFLGKIDLAKTYFLLGAGTICHMLIMAWGGDPISKIEDSEALKREVSRSKKEIRSLGVLHKDLRPDNILWNVELGRALIIDFHLCELDHRPMKRMKLSKKHRSYTA